MITLPPGNVVPQFIQKIESTIRSVGSAPPTYRFRVEMISADCETNHGVTSVGFSTV